MYEILIGFMASGLTMMYQRALFPNMIFYPFMRLLIKWMAHPKKKYLAKVLGHCVYCNGFWIAVMSIIVSQPNYSDIVSIGLMMASWYVITLLLVHLPDSIHIVTTEERIDVLRSNFKN